MRFYQKLCVVLLTVGVSLCIFSCKDSGTNAPEKYTLTVTTVHGTVVKSPDGTSYDANTVVQLTATPAVGYTFTGWTGDTTATANPISITMKSTKNITANFLPTINLNDSTYLQGTWEGNDPGSGNYVWDYIFAGNSIVIKRDSVMQDSGVYSFDTNSVPNKMDIQIIKAANTQNNGKKISTIYTVSQLGSFVLMYIPINEPGAARPDSLGNVPDSLMLRLRYKLASEF